MSKFDAKVDFLLNDEGVVKVSGEVNYHTVTQLLAATNRLLVGKGPWIVDLSGVIKSDSSAIAWMLDWLRKGREKNTDIEFRAVPQEIKTIARVSGVEELIPIVG